MTSRRESAARRQGETRQQFHYSFLKILSGSDLSRRRLPYMEARGPRGGPTVWLTGGCHGDEVGGIVVVQEVFRRLRKCPLTRGAVRAFPLMNPLGFEAGARYITLSQEDLNRTFPGTPSGTLAERIADTIFQSIVATSPQVVLDLHNDWIRSIPYTLLDPPADADRDEAYARVARLATESGFLVVKETSALRRTLSHSLLCHGVPALTIELGESYVVNERNVEFGVQSVFNVLRVLGLIKDGAEPFRFPSPPGAPDGPLEYSQQPVSSTSGIIRFLARPGELVYAGQPIAKIVNAFGRLSETLKAPADAIVLGLTDSSVAFPGAPVMAFGQLP